MPKWFIDAVNAVGKSDIRNVVLLLDGLIILGLVYLIAIRAVPPGNRETIYMALGIALGVYASGRNYLFGQSKSENDKKQTP